MSKQRVVISMLRSLNLAKHNRVSMEELRWFYESLGLHEPRTYVQSGNVVFQSAETDLTRLAGRIEGAMEKKLGFRTPVILRTTAEMRDVVRRNPIADRPGIDGAKFLVVFLAAAPEAEACEKVRKIDAHPEELWIDGREVYAWFPNGLARPKLSSSAVEKALKVPGTGRNWNTVTKLLEMAEALESK